MKQKMKQVLAMVAIVAFTLASITSYEKPGGKKVNYGKAPRKLVPAAMTGDWFYTSVSNTNMQYSNGHTASGWTFGSVFHINADGTGWEIITTSTNSYGSATTARVESDGTFEIEVDANNHVSFKYYPVQGKVYDNNVFSHNLMPEKTYLKKIYNWAGTLGKDTKGSTFTTSENLVYHKQ